MKAILMSIKPRFVADILNGKKTIEVRKRFPKDYRGWVYIYVTKALPHLSKTYVGDYEVYDDTQWNKMCQDFNGEVVGRFYCDNVEEIDNEEYGYDDNDEGEMVDWYFTESLKAEELQKKTCLRRFEIANYLQREKGYAIHISQLEIFDEPKELSEFGYRCCNYNVCVNCEFYHNGKVPCSTMWIPLTKAPQSWQYIEVE